MAHHTTYREAIKNAAALRSIHRQNVVTPTPQIAPHAPHTPPPADAPTESADDRNATIQAFHTDPPDDDQTAADDTAAKRERPNRRPPK